MQRKMIIFCAAIVVLCSIGVYVSARKQKLSCDADKWINESANVLTSTLAWIEIEYELQVQKKQKMIDIFIEKAEYAYQCDCWLGDSSLQSLERQEALPIELYWKDGTYYFVPTDECNTELSSTGRRARCNPLYKEKYLFYDSLDAEYVTGMLYLGQVEIDTLTDSIPEMPKLTENGYIDAVLDIIRKNGNAGELPVGNYKIYIGNYWYVGIDQVYIDGVIQLDETYKFFYGSAIRNSDGSYDAYVGSANGNLQYFEYPIKDNCDFSDIVKNHEILTYDICSSPKYDYENTPLAEYIEEVYVAYNEEMSEKIGMPLSLTIDYHQFNFNDDGLEDYLLCVDGSLFSGSAGNTVELYIQEEEGTVRKVLDINLRLINSYSPTGHEAFAVLDEKTDGCYAIVLPESNRILRYDKEKD